VRLQAKSLRRIAAAAPAVLAFVLVLAITVALATALSGCTHKRRIWIYTSIYKEVIAEMKPELEKAMPDVEIRWFQGGSENVSARINTELVAGRTQADLVLTSDPFWYLELKKSGKLLAYDSPAAREVPAQFVDPDHAFAAVRIPMMVMGYNPEAFPVQGRALPSSWKDLASPRFKDQLSMGSPLESGTSFTAVALLSQAPGLGWDWFKELRKLELTAAGGNSSVINRMETRERPVGVVLLENILKARKKGSPVQAIYPSDGSIPIPSPIAILADSRNPELAKKVYDWFFTVSAQNAIVHAGMYSPLAKIASPVGAKPWSELSKQMMPWSPKILSELYEKREEIKSKFSETVIH
jgi:iron(III) transport system substrate-binding protein